jgi:predicted nucleic acid-binding Zn ribbon protein
MPTYVYKFIDTGETIEVQQAFTDDALTHAKHPATGKKLKVKKVFTPVGVTFKGGGFYKTDSRGGKSKSSSSATATESSSSSSESSSSSDAAKSSDSGKSGDSGSAPATPASTTAKAPAAKAPSSTD